MRREIVFDQVLSVSSEMGGTVTIGKSSS